jgi:hypothetical protein
MRPKDENEMTLQTGKEDGPSPFLTIRRAAWALAGILWFLWIGYEDRGLTPILILSMVIMVPMGIELYQRWSMKDGEEKATSMLKGIAVGGISGVLVIPIAVILASMKTSLHQHESLDFSREDFILLVDHLPVWIIAGMFIGTGASIWGKSNVEDRSRGSSTRLG